MSGYEYKTDLFAKAAEHPFLVKVLAIGLLGVLVDVLLARKSARLGGAGQSKLILAGGVALICIVAYNLARQKTGAA